MICLRQKHIDKGDYKISCQQSRYTSSRKNTSKKSMIKNYDQVHILAPTKKAHWTKQIYKKNYLTCSSDNEHATDQ